MLMDELKDAVHDQKKGEVPALPDKPEEQPPTVEPNDPAVAVPSRLPRIPGLPAGMTPTRRCPSCESGECSRYPALC